MKRWLQAALVAFFIFYFWTPSFGATCVRMLGGPGPLNSGDIKFTAGGTYGAGGEYTDEYSGDCNGRRVYLINLSMIPFLADNTVVGEDLYPLAAGDTWSTFYWNGSGVPTALAIGTSGYVLTSNGPSAAPSWEAPSGGGTIASTSSVLKGDGAGNAVAAVEDTDYLGVTSNAATASALAANPSDCTGGQFAVGIDADGSAVCDTPAGSGDMLASVYDADADNVVDLAEGLSAQYIDWDSVSGGDSIANKPSLGTASAQDTGTLTDTYLCIYSTSANGFVCNTAPSTYQAADTNLTTLSSPGNDKVFYSDGSGNIQTTTIGTSGTFLKSNGPGSAPSWDPGGAGTPGGSDTQVQFNDSSSFGGDAGMTYNKTTNTLTISDNVVIGDTLTVDSLDMPQSATDPDYIALREISGNGSNYIGFIVPSAITTDYLLQLPDDTPNDEILSCAAPSAGISACSWTTTGTATAIPYGASPTVDDPGEIAVDTTSDQLVYYGGAKRVLSYEREICVTLEDLTDADDAYEFFEFRKAATLTAASAHCRGTCSTPATITFQDRATNGVTLGSTLTASTGTGDSTWVSVSSGGSFNAGEGIAFNVTNTPTTGDVYTICVAYTITSD